MTYTCHDVPESAPRRGTVEVAKRVAARLQPAACDVPTNLPGGCGQDRKNGNQETLPGVSFLPADQQPLSGGANIPSPDVMEKQSFL